MAILASLVVAGYGKVQEQAKLSKAKSDLTQLDQAIRVARENTQKTLREITQTNYTASACIFADAWQLPPSATCWNRYRLSIERIEQAAGVSLASLKNGTPWRTPYIIDENEGEQSQSCNVRDTVRVPLYKDPIEYLQLESGTTLFIPRYAPPTC